MDIADKKFKKVKEERDKLEKQFSEFDNVKNKL